MFIMRIVQDKQSRRSGAPPFVKRMGDFCLGDFRCNHHGCPGRGVCIQSDMLPGGAVVAAVVPGELPRPPAFKKVSIAA